MTTPTVHMTSQMWHMPVCHLSIFQRLFWTNYIDQNITPLGPFVILYLHTFSCDAFANFQLMQKCG